MRIERVAICIMAGVLLVAGGWFGRGQWDSYRNSINPQVINAVNKLIQRVERLERMQIQKSQQQQ